MSRTFLDIAMDPHGAAAERSRRAGTPLGVAFSSYFPLEVFDAFGLAGVFLPMVARPRYPLADAAIQAYTCAYMRSCAESVLSGDLPVGLVGSVSGCDALTSLPGVFAASGVAVPVVHLRLPIAVWSSAAPRQADLVLLEFCREAERALGRPLDAMALERAAERRQEVRKRVAGLLARMASGEVASSWVYGAAFAAQVLDPDEFLDRLPAEEAQAPRSAPGSIPVLLSGSVLPSPQVVLDLESLGARVVADDTCHGTRGCSRRVEGPSPDPLARVAMSLVARAAHGPDRFVGMDRVRGVVALAKAAGARAAVLFLEKYCDPHAFEAPSLVGALRNAGIPAVVVESDRDPGLSSRDRTLVQTLLETMP